MGAAVQSIKRHQEALKLSAVDAASDAVLSGCEACCSYPGCSTGHTPLYVRMSSHISNSAKDLRRGDRDELFDNQNNAGDAQRQPWFRVGICRTIKPAAVM